MNVKINFENLINLAHSYMYEWESYYEYRAEKYGRRESVWTGRDPELDYKYYSMKQADAALYAACRVTGIDYKIVMDAARIERDFERRTNYEKLLFGVCDYENRREKLLDVLSARSPEDLAGIYSSEFYEAAVERMYNKKYAEYNAYWYGK